MTTRAGIRADSAPWNREGGAKPPESEGNARSRKVLWVNVAVLAVAGTIMYQLFPRFTQNIVFDGVVRNSCYGVPLVALLWGVLRYLRAHVFAEKVVRVGDHRRPIAVATTLAVLYVIWALFMYAGTDYLTYRMYAANFVERKGLIPTAPESVRFTPLLNACTDIGNSVSSTGEQVECKYVRPIVNERSFGYAAPITPSGVFNTFLMQNPGFLYLDDSASVAQDPPKRITRLDDVQKVGPGMEWFDSLEYALAKADFFANYDTPHYLVLDPAQPKKLTLVAPKIKYGYMWRLPYWGGVTLVHSDGTIENLNPAQALADKRLKDQWIFPESLARYYVHLQNYRAGYGLFTPFMRVAGKLAIEPLVGNNQFPFVTRAADKKTYLVTATRGEGAAQGLFRMYYVNAWNGEGSFHQFDSHEVVYGAGASRERLTNIPGYQWYRGGEKSSGTIVAIEPVYIVRPNDKTLYWKYTITNVNYSGISATAVANASRPDAIKVFAQREDFEEWLRGNDVAPSGTLPATLGAKEKILRTIEEMGRQLDQLKRDAQSLR